MIPKRLLIPEVGNLANVATPLTRRKFPLPFLLIITVSVGQKGGGGGRRRKREMRRKRKEVRSTLCELMNHGFSNLLTSNCKLLYAPAK